MSAALASIADISHLFLEKAALLDHLLGLWIKKTFLIVLLEGFAALALSQKLRFLVEPITNINELIGTAPGDVCMLSYVVHPNRFIVLAVIKHSRI